MSLGYGKAQTNILTIIFIITMMVMLVTPVIFVLVDENSDWPNALTLVVEVAVGVLIAHHSLHPFRTPNIMQIGN